MLKHIIEQTIPLAKQPEHELSIHDNMRLTKLTSDIVSVLLEHPEHKHEVISSFDGNINLENLRDKILIASGLFTVQRPKKTKSIKDIPKGNGFQRYDL